MGAGDGTAEARGTAPVEIALFEPEIPGNTGAIGRLCAATGTTLHLIGRLGFSLQHPAARRAAMDYWGRIQVHRHIAFDDFRAATHPRRIFALSTRATDLLWDVEFVPGDILLFGPESRGLDDEILSHPDIRPVRIPMAGDARSLNLATAAAITLYEALRQLREHA